MSIVGKIEYNGPAQAGRHWAMKRLEQVASGEIDRLAVFMPPGSAKSTYSSILFPPWFLAQRPKASIIAASRDRRRSRHNGADGEPEQAEQQCDRRKFRHCGTGWKAGEPNIRACTKCHDKCGRSHRNDGAATTLGHRTGRSEAGTDDESANGLFALPLRPLA
jgi:hypothetical protein